MGKLCMYCMEEYKNDEITSPYKHSEVGLYQDCPKRSCRGKVYTIDDNLVTTITILNSKGYPTYSSCSGHHVEVDTECYIEFVEDIKSLPSLPEGFKLRMKTTNGKSRICIYRKPESEDPIDQFLELLDFTKILYSWAMSLNFNFEQSDIIFVDLRFTDPSSVSFFDYDISNTEKEKDKKERPSKKKLDIDKLKETAPNGSIKLKRENTEKDKEQENQKTISESTEKQEDKPKKKRGRPKKNND